MVHLSQYQTKIFLNEKICIISAGLDDGTELLTSPCILLSQLDIHILLPQLDNGYPPPPCRIWLIRMVDIGMLTGRTICVGNCFILCLEVENASISVVFNFLVHLLCTFSRMKLKYNVWV